MKNKQGKYHAPGTLVIVFIFLLVFVALYFIDWALLSETWSVR